jgi:hypothetical protein
VKENYTFGRKKKNGRKGEKGGEKKNSMKGRERLVRKIHGNKREAFQGDE